MEFDARIPYEKLQGRHVVLGLSGGVDSSVSAALLKENGMHVTALFMKNWEEDDTNSYCAAAKDREDAQKVCDKLNSILDENEQLRKENDMLSCELSVSANKEISRNCRIAELEEENEQLKQYKQSVNDVLRSWSQKNLTAKQLQVVLAIMEELNVIGDVE